MYTLTSKQVMRIEKLSADANYLNIGQDFWTGIGEIV